MIFVFTDPGVNGAISAVNEREEILFSVALENGLPPGNFYLKSACIADNFREKIVQFRIEGTPMSEWLNDCHFAIEIADYKNVEVGTKKASGKITMANLAYKAGINTGKIIQWFTERGIHDMVKVKPREWQTICKGFGGDSKQKAFGCLRQKYCILKGGLKRITECKACSHDCPLKKHGIIGPRGGYIDGNGDSLCGALYLKSEVMRQAKVR